MTHRPGCEDTPVLHPHPVTALGSKRWFIWRCPTCAAIELRDHHTTPKES